MNSTHSHILAYERPTPSFKRLHLSPDLYQSFYMLARSYSYCRYHSRYTIAQAFVSGWISRFGVSSTSTADQGHQFDSELWKLMQLLESKQVHTTAYHPIANGLIERFHRQLKTSLKSQPNPTHWMEILSQFRRVTCLSSRLNALVASTKIIASMSSPAKRCSIAWTATSHPASCPR